MKTEDKIQEPEEFYIISDIDDLFLNSKKAVKLLLYKLESVEYNEELANFYSKFHNEIDDRLHKFFFNQF